MSLTSKMFSVFKRDVFLFFTEMLTSIVIARQLGPEMMGFFTLLLIMPTYAEILGRLKLDQSAVYILGKKNYHLGEVVFTLDVLAIATSSLILGIVFLNFEVLFEMLFKTHIEMRNLAIMCVFMVPINFLNLNYSYLHTYTEEIKDYNRMLLIKALGTSILSLVMLLVFKMGLLGVVCASLFGLGASTMYGAYSLHKTVPYKPTYNPRLITDLIGYGLTLYFTGLVGGLNRYCMSLIVAVNLVPSQMAFFSMAKARAELMNKVPSAISLLLFPRISKSTSVENSATLASRAFRISFIILAGIAIGGALLIKPAVFVLYGSKYYPLIPVFLVIVPGMVVSGATMPLVDYFTGTGKARFSFFITLAAFVSQLAFSLFLVPRFHLLGAALALTGAMVVQATIRTIVFSRVAQNGALSSLIPRKEDFQMLKAFILSRLGKSWGGKQAESS